MIRHVIQRPIAISMFFLALVLLGCSSGCSNKSSRMTEPKPAAESPAVRMLRSQTDALLQAIGPTRVSLITYVIPVIGVTLGVLFLKERLDWSLAVAAILIVAGVWAVNRK